MVLSGFERKTFLILATLLLLLYSCTSPSFNVVAPLRELPPSARCVAIYPFRNLSSVPDAGVVVSQIFYDVISRRRGWNVVNWDTVVRLREAKIVKLSTPPTNEQIAQFGRKIGAGSVLYGSVLNFNYRFTGTGVLVPVVSFSAKLIDTATGRVIWSGLTSVIGSLNDSVVTLAKKVVGGMVDDIERRTGKGRYECNLQKNIWTIAGKTGFFRVRKKVKKYGKLAERIYNLINTRDRFILEGVKFIDRSSRLTPESYQTLDALGEVLVDNPSIRLRIECHTDLSGNSALDRKVTEDQAKVLFQYLISRFNISPNRLQVIGKGSDYPLLPNISRRNRQLNRRVEVVVLSR